MKPISAAVVRMVVRRIVELTRRLDGAEVTATEKAKLELVTLRLQKAVESATVR